MWVRVWAVLALLLAVFPIAGGCISGQGFESRLDLLIAPYQFNVLSWELLNLPGAARDCLLPVNNTADGESLVREFFSLNERISSLRGRIDQASASSNSSAVPSLQSELDSVEQRKAAISQQVEQVLRQQVGQAFAGEGIFNPLAPLEVFFPPVCFRLEPPPHLLVISPRTRIEPIREITLKQQLSIEEMESIETGVDELGVSSLVVGLGGISTYPAFVADGYDLRFTLEVIAEEWLHQYLAFTPLGFLYVLDVMGVRPDYQVATMNETLAGMVSDEIAAAVYEEHYARFQTGDGETGDQEQPASGFNFRREMRGIRQAVDSYLAVGEVEKAEQYMEQKRNELAEHGYYIRKLNQAYFAFHGTYGDSPASVSPIRGELGSLRAGSESLRDFLDKVAGMTSYQELHEAAS